MSQHYERLFRVRFYECDAYGHVNHANYLRYMQEAAMEASAAVGYDNDRYDALNAYWLIRETDITYLRSLTYGQQVIVKTWVLDFRRVRSRRAYELRLATTGELVAQATTDWVYVDGQSLRPITVPQEMIAAFWPEGQPPPPAGTAGILPASAGAASLPASAGTVPRREPFPEAPPAPPGVFRSRHQIEWRDIDGAQHLNNASYMVYIENCAVQMGEAHGWPMSRMMAAGSNGAGFGIVTRRYRLEYRQPALFGDEIEVATWVSDVRRATAVRHYTIHRVSDGELLARANVLWVFIDLASGKPVRIPADFLRDLAPNVVEEAPADNQL